MLCVTVVAILSVIATDFTHGSTDLPEIPDGITIHKVISDWDEAFLECKSEGAVLASPINTELLNVMKSLIGVNNTPYFIGTRSRDNPRLFKSVEGVPLQNMTAAVLQMIQQLDPHEDSCLSMDVYSIRVVPCWVRLPFLFYRAPSEQIHYTTEKAEVNMNTTTEKTRRDVTTQYGVCGVEGYNYNKTTGSCYKLHTNSKNWDEAAATCVTEGGHLVVIDDDVEAECVKYIGTRSIFNAQYIGIRDYTGHNDWKSVTGKSLKDIYNDWSSDRPRCDSCFCGAISASGVLDNLDCSWIFDFICEKQPLNI